MQIQLRQMQDQFANEGWRIQLISHAPDGKPVIIGLENWAGYIAGIAMLGFPIGVGWAIYSKKHGQEPSLGICIAVASWVVCLIAVGIKNKLKKQDWVHVAAKCIDREILKGHAPQGGSTWAIRIVCEIEHQGAVLQCTPTVHWKTFRTESAAIAFLASRISNDGACTLKLNSSNALEAQLDTGMGR